MSLIIRSVQVLKGWVRQLLPNSIIELVRFKSREKRLAKIREQVSEFDLADFTGVLDHLKVNSGGNLFVHSGADWVGKVEGGPFAILKCLMEYMDKGTLMMPSFPIEGMARDYIDKHTFSSKRTPSKMGLLTELFRRTENVKRSLHPTHSVCAFGMNADMLIENHHKCQYPFEASSPFGKSVTLEGQILLIGVGLEVLTHVHTVEDSMGEDFPYKVYEKNERKIVVIDENDSEIPLVTFVHNPAVSVRKNIPQFETEMIEQDVMSKAKIAGIEFSIFDSAKLESFLYKKACLGMTIYD